MLYGTPSVIVSLLEQETSGEVVAAFLHVRSSTRSHSSSSSGAVPNREGRMLRRTEMDKIQDTR